MTPILLLAAVASFTCVSPHVSDGDTISHCAGHTVRLMGVNSPEIAHPGLHILAEPGGQEARAALTRLTAGKTVTCTPAGNQHDRYRRVVARCFVEGRDVAVLMLGAGEACRWARYDRARIYVGIGQDCLKNGKPQ